MGSQSDSTNVAITGFNFLLNQLGAPYAWTSNWGNGVQFNMNSIMQMTPWQAYNFQAINGMVNFGIPINPFSACTMDFAGIDSSVNLSMNQRVYSKAETALKTLDSTVENLEKMLTQEGVTEAQKTTIKEQIKKIHELQAKIEAMKPELKTDKDWLENFDAFEALMGEKTEIDTKIKELIEEVAEQNEADDDDAVDGDGAVDDDDAVDGDSDSDSDTDPDSAAATSAVATTKSDAQSNLATVYGENAPASVTVGDDGKLSREVTVVKDGKSVKETKTYESIEAMQTDTKKLTATTKADAEENLKIVYGENIPEGMTAADNGKITIAYKDVENGQAVDKNTTADNIEAAEKILSEAQARMEALSTAQAEAQKQEMVDARSVEVYNAVKEYDKNVENISNTFADAINGEDTFWGGTHDKNLKAAISQLNENNIIEVMDHFYTSEKNKNRYNPVTNNDDAEDFIEAFENDADSSQQYELGNYIYNALLLRAYKLGLVGAKNIPQLPEDSDEFDRIKKDDLEQYTVTAKTGQDQYLVSDGSNVSLAAQFNTLLAELNAPYWTNSGKVNTAVRNIVEIIKSKEAQSQQ